MKNFLLQRKTTVLPVPDITLRDVKYARIAQFWAQSLDQQSVDKKIYNQILYMFVDGW